MSLRLRMTLAVTVALTATTFLSAVAMYVVVGDRLRAETARTLRQLADRPERRRSELGTAGSELRFSPGGHRAGPPLPPPLRFGGPEGYRQLVRADGSVQRGSGDDQALPVTDADLRIARDGRGELLRDDVTVDGTHLMVLTVGIGDGALQVARPLSEVDRVLRQTATALVVVSMLGVGMSVILGLLVSRVAIRPITRFTREAEQIAAAPGARGRLDVTGTDEVSRLAATFNTTLDSLERSLDAQARLIADAGHELRTPLASIRANVQLLDDADRLDPADVDALRADIVAELDELTELLADVIELARGTDPDAPTDDVRLDEVVAAAARRAATRGTGAVQLDLQLQPTIVRGDAARIARAISNLVDNARKWSPDGGSVEVSLDDGVVRVRDHGPGFQHDDLEHVFERFWRAPTARAMPGSGLGLAIVQQTAHAHGGWVRAYNADDDGGGAVVELYFGAGSPPDVDAAT